MARSKKGYPQGMTLQMVSTYLVRETVSSELNSVSTPEDAAKVVRDLFDFDHLDREQFVALALNTKNRVIGAWAVSVGSLNASIVHPRELFKPAVMLSAASIVIAHNHPSGDPTPSGADIQLTRRLVKGGDVLGIELLDHVVVGDESIASFRDLGLM
jgi:DNA repair protein RadC